MSEQTRLHLFDIDVPLARPIRTGDGAMDRRRSIIVGWERNGLIGWGEAPAFPSARFGTADAAWNDLTTLNRDATVPIAAAALIAAQTDHAARVAETPLYRHLGGAATDVLARYPIGLVDPTGIDAVIDSIGTMTAVKVKICPGHTAGLASIRDARPDLDIGVDANGTLDDPDDPVFSELAEIGVSFVEQPFPTADLASHARLAQRGLVPVCLDESINDPTTIEQALDSCDSISIKVNRHGWTRFEELRSTAIEAGVEVRVGGTFDTSIGRRHVLAAATLPGVTDAEAAPPSTFLSDDIAEYPELRKGRVRPTDAPGIGTEPDPAALDRLTRRRVTIELGP